MTPAEMLDRLRCVERMDGSVPELERDRLFARVLIWLVELERYEEQIRAGGWPSRGAYESDVEAGNFVGDLPEPPKFHRPKASVRVVEDDGA